MRLFLLIPLLLSSCVVASKDAVMAVGGKGAYKSRDFGLVFDNEGSFRDAAALAGVGIGAWQSVASQRSADALNAARSSDATQLGAIQSNNAKDIAIEGIKGDVTKATTIPK
jgi:hypothetical protein